MTKSDLIRLRFRMLAMLAELDTTVANARISIQESSETIPSYLQDVCDAAKGEIDLKNALKVYQHGVAHRDVLRHALVRMETGGYGTCLDCGNEIGIRRLEALPGANLCTQCQQEREFGTIPDPKPRTAVNQFQIRRAA